MVTASKSPRQKIHLVLLSTVYTVIRTVQVGGEHAYNKAFNEAISERRIVCVSKDAYVSFRDNRYTIEFSIGK